MLTLLVAVQAATAQPSASWPNAALGMTIAELQAVRPSARPIPAAESSRWRTACGLADGTFAIDGVMLDVCYEVRDGRVAAVLLHSPIRDHGGAADRFKAALLARYGTPVLDVCGGFDRIIGSQSCSTVWKAGSVTIKSDRTKVAGRHIISLEYRAAPLGSAS